MLRAVAPSGAARTSSNFVSRADETPTELDPRAAKARNYRVKRAAGWTCSEPGCVAAFDIRVFRVAEGEADDAFVARCKSHGEGLEPAPWQMWQEAEAEAERKPPRGSDGPGKAA